MATKNSTMTGLKPSFASIAAMAPPAHNRQVGSSVNPLDISSTVSPSKQTPATAESTSAKQLHQELQTSMSRLTVKELPSVSDATIDQGNSVAVKAGLRFDDDQTQVSSSSTKPASLDGKSATSGTTFALDEKESLRPDDSASVKAAEEEDFYSGPVSGAANSRVGSEAGSRAFRDQFYEISERMGPSAHRSHPISRRGIPGIQEEGQQMSLAPLIPTLPAPDTVSGPESIATNGSCFGYTYLEPDEKLLEALESQKDRLFLLQLEETIIKFVRDSTEPILDLPSCHSFYRLLTHKLADYYALTHFVDNAVSAVRLYRTPYCRLPSPLSAIPRLPASTDPNPVSQPAVKIMRRAGLGKDGQANDSGAATNDSSKFPSKSGSEAEDGSQQGTGVASPTDSSNAKDKASMTREEREAKYKETRERIFKGFENNDNADGDATAGILLSNEASRTGSANEKKKTKKHRNNDDGFHARSQYNAYYPAMQYPATTFDQTGTSAAYFSPYGIQQVNTMGASGNLSPPMFQQGYNQGYHSMPSTPAYQMAMQQSPVTSGSNMTGQVNGLGVYNQQMPQQYYQPMPQPMIGHHSPAVSSPALSSHAQLSRPQPQMPDQPWSQNGLPYSYQQSRNQQPVYPPQMHDRPPVGIPVVPYQYGQLPYQPNAPGGKAPHPLPGSYNRQAFNPQTRAFVPSTGFVPLQNTAYGGRTLSNGSQTQPYSQQPGTYLHPSSTPSMPFASPMPGHGPFVPGHDSKSYGTRKNSSQTTDSQSPGQSSLSKWGTPANLPPKPPPLDVPSMPETHHSLPMNIHANMNLHGMGNGQPMPSFQNGAYSVPGQAGV